MSKSIKLSVFSSFNQLKESRIALFIIKTGLKLGLTRAKLGLKQGLTQAKTKSGLSMIYTGIKPSLNPI